MSMSHRSPLGCLNQPPTYHSHSMTQSSTHSSVGKIATTPQRTSSQDSASDSIRKRVCKACDRCRLKKSKCDGSSPCSRCKQDNAVCVFGERKKAQDKIYPKGYVEMLEQQQGQLVAALQEMYKRAVAADAWEGDLLSETNGHPLTHDILARLDLIENKTDGSNEPERFEDDPEALQSRLIAQGAGYSNQRRNSFSSDSDHSQHSHARSQSHSTTTFSRSIPVCKPDYTFQSAPSSPPPPAHSPASLQQQQQPSFPAPQPSPLQHSSPLNNDAHLYQADWAQPEQDQKYMLQSDFALQTPELDQTLGSMGGMSGFTWPHVTSAAFDTNMTSFAFPQMTSGFSNVPRLQGGMLNELPMDSMQMEQDFLNFQVQTA